MSNKVFAISALVFAWLGAGGCFPAEGPADGQTSRLIPFESEQQLLRYFKDQAKLRSGGGDDLVRLFGFGGLPVAEGAGGEAPAVDGDSATGGGSFSGTNLQEAGVDESDVFKTDGQFFYIARNQSLRIARATPLAELEEVGRLDVEDYISEMYLNGDEVILLAQRYENIVGPGIPVIDIWPPYYVGSFLVLYRVDVSDRTSPTVLERVELDGSLTSSRVTGGRLIVVLSIAPKLPADPTPLAIEFMTLDEVMPKLRSAQGGGDMVVWSDWLRPEVPDGYFMTAVVTFDVGELDSALSSVAVMANAGTVYSSTEALYITDASYDPADNYREITTIHKFEFEENGAAQYVATGTVSGRPLNQFSLGEHEGLLRIATHISQTGVVFGEPVVVGGGGVVADGGGAEPSDAGKPKSSAADEILPPPPYNAVFVLAQDAADLKTIGAVEGIAPNERLYAARFLGERGFLVTFQQIDPLFALDLSDPTNPIIAGELELPGYSDYLHPFGENMLIGVGRSVEQTQCGGVIPDALQLSLFDVSDLASPTLVEQIAVGGQGSYSDVSYTHKAFALLEEEGLLALPVVIMPESNPSGSLSPFFGALCFHVDATGFTEIGNVEAVTDGFGFYGAWNRAAMIDGAVYSLTPGGVRAAPVGDMTQSYTLKLPE